MNETEKIIELLEEIHLMLSAQLEMMTDDGPTYGVCEVQIDVNEIVNRIIANKDAVSIRRWQWGM